MVAAILAYRRTASCAPTSTTGIFIIMKLWMTTASVVVALASAAPASADDNNGYGVGTSAVAGNFFKFTGATSTYRMGADSSGNYTRIGDVAPQQTDGCAARLANVPTDVCVATKAGPLTPSFNLTASSNTASIIMNDGNLATLGNGNAFAYADLSSGKVGASADGSYGFSGQGVSAFNDLLTFSVAGADANTVTNIGITFTIDGVLAGANNAYGVADVRGALGFGGATANLYYQQVQSDPVFARLAQTGWVSGSWDSNSSPGSSTFNGVYALLGSSQILGISSFLSAGAGSGAISDYSNTSTFRLNLPSNVTFTSASGVFLNAVGNPSAHFVVACSAADFASSRSGNAGKFRRHLVGAGDW